MSAKWNWTGASGSNYEYAVHELPWRPGADQEGNYIFAKIVNRTWHAVYIGQGDLQQRYDAANREGCVRSKGATHYHVHNNRNRSTREREEKDLISGNPECNWPKGCNGHV